MTHPTDEELDALERELWESDAASSLTNRAARAITAIRAQLAEANARADRAEAALAAQIEDACAVIDAHAEYDQTFCCDGRECGCQGASVHDVMKHFIRNLPHDRTAPVAPAEAAKVQALVDALEDAHDALVSAKAYILKKSGTINPAREEAITKVRAALAASKEEK